MARCRSIIATNLVLAFLLVAAPARADVAFGGDPTRPVTPGLSCQLGAPSPFGTPGSTSCMWSWNSLANGTDLVPIPVTGGAGTITSVTMPAMPNPGPMQVVVLTAGLAATTIPSQPDSICCQVKAVGPVFTVPAGQVTTVPQNLRVSATEGSDLSRPGDTSFGDMMGISVLSPTASLPLLYTGNIEVNANYDGGSAYYPAPSGPRGEFIPPFNVAGFQLLARFNFAPDGPAPAAGGGNAPAPGAAAPAPGANGGLRLLPGALRLGQDGRTLRLGQATNPPTARTVQTLTAANAARASATASAKKPKRQLVLGRGATRVPSGKTAPVALKLNGKGKARLRKAGRLRATLTVVSRGTDGRKQTTRRVVTVKPPAPKKKKKGK